MAECNICGSNAPLVEAEIGGTTLRVCSDCAKSGKIIEKPKEYVPIEQKKTFHKIPTVNQKASDKSAYLGLKSGAETILVDDFGNRVKSARENLGLKQEELAKKINEHVSVIHAIETQKRNPNEKVAKKLERFLKINLYEIIE